jgi:hypothetical protein
VAITTWLQPHEAVLTDDHDVRALLDELEARYGERWRAVRYTRPLWRRWFNPWNVWRPMLPRVTWSLYYEYHPDEWQVINFYREGTDWSINTSVSKELIVAYLHGYLGQRAHHQASRGENSHG